MIIFFDGKIFYLFYLSHTYSDSYYVYMCMKPCSMDIMIWWNVLYDNSLTLFRTHEQLLVSVVVMWRTSSVMNLTNLTSSKKLLTQFWLNLCAVISFFISIIFNLYCIIFHLHYIKTVFNIYCKIQLKDCLFWFITNEFIGLRWYGTPLYCGVLTIEIKKWKKVFIFFPLPILLPNSVAHWVRG